MLTKILALNLVTFLKGAIGPHFEEKNCFTQIWQKLKKFKALDEKLM